LCVCVCQVNPNPQFTRMLCLRLSPLRIGVALQLGDRVVVLVSGDGALTEDGIVAADSAAGSATVSISIYGEVCDLPREEIALWAANAALS